MLRDLAVPVALLGVLASLLLPLPPIIIDFLLVANMIFALVLLISTLYISDPLKLSALPSILLLATLYRLALNISTTRMILGGGEAGTVIEAFGSIVIQGNLVVGAIVFLIITLIQFIVIAKGSERVAEVSARFTLDALPGKQMSIDADVRSGLIDVDDASKKRDQLQIESRFYGALDGAMKFIKGDAIAGIAITAINVIGGFCIGVFVLNLDVSTAVSTFTLLTVGDGLLSQIPALLQSLAAGMVVTRVVGLKESSLAVDLLSQIGQVRKVKVLIGLLALMLAVVPGMPFLPFATLAVLLLGNALMSEADAPSIDAANGPPVFVPQVPPVVKLELGSSVVEWIQEHEGIVQTIESCRQEIYNSFGLVLLPPAVGQFSGSSDDVQILIHGIPAAQAKLVRDSENPSTFFEALRDFFVECITARYPELIDDTHTKRVLDAFENEAPDLVNNLVPNVVSVTQVTDVFRQLAKESLSIKHVNLILQAIAEAAPEVGQNQRLLLERVRVCLHRLISNQYASGRIIQGALVDPVVDLAFVKVEREQGILEPEMIDVLAKEYQELNKDIPLVTSVGARRIIRECLEVRGIQCSVIALQEISPDFNFECIATLGSAMECKYSEEIMEEYEDQV